MNTLKSGGVKYSEVNSIWTGQYKMSGLGRRFRYDVQRRSHGDARRADQELVSGVH